MSEFTFFKQESHADQEALIPSARRPPRDAESLGVSNLRVMTLNAFAGHAMPTAMQCLLSQHHHVEPPLNKASWRWKDQCDRILRLAPDVLALQEVYRSSLVELYRSQLGENYEIIYHQANNFKGWAFLLCTASALSGIGAVAASALNRILTGTLTHAMMLGVSWWHWGVVWTAIESFMVLWLSGTTFGDFLLGDVSGGMVLALRRGKVRLRAARSEPYRMGAHDVLSWGRERVWQAFVIDAAIGEEGIYEHSGAAERPTQDQAASVARAAGPTWARVLLVHAHAPLGECEHTDRARMLELRLAIEAARGMGRGTLHSSSKAAPWLGSTVTSGCWNGWAQAACGSVALPLGGTGSARAAANLPLVLMGDLNAGPDSQTVAGLGLHSACASVAAHVADRQSRTAGNADSAGLEAPEPLQWRTWDDSSNVLTKGSAQEPDCKLDWILFCPGGAAGNCFYTTPPRVSALATAHSMKMRCDRSSAASAAIQPPADSSSTCATTTDSSMCRATEAPAPTHDAEMAQCAALDDVSTGGSTKVQETPDVASPPDQAELSDRRWRSLACPVWAVHEDARVQPEQRKAVQQALSPAMVLRDACVCLWEPQAPSDHYAVAADFELVA